VRMHGRQVCSTWSSSLSYCVCTAAASIWSNTECSIAFTPPQACLGHTDIRFAV
jgi:hypothetical protein